MIKLDGCNVTTAKSIEEIISNINCNKNNFKELDKFEDWREEVPFAVIGGGPSLKNYLSDIKKYKYVMACGSVHDYLVNNDIIPDYCVLCDPDEIIIEYIKKAGNLTHFLVASQCSPKVFNYLCTSIVYITKWHAGAGNLDNSIFGENKIIIGGGCTVGTRAICLAMGMGYNNIHLYGFDTCLDEEFRHHAYEFVDKEKETIGNIHEISLDGPSGKKFYVAGYMLGQLFDFQSLLRHYGNRIKFTVHGQGLLKHLMEIAEIKSKEFQNGN